MLGHLVFNVITIFHPNERCFVYAYACCLEIFLRFMTEMSEIALKYLFIHLFILTVQSQAENLSYNFFTIYTISSIFRPEVIFGIKKIDRISIDRSMSLLFLLKLKGIFLVMALSASLAATEASFANISANPIELLCNTRIDPG